MDERETLTGDQIDSMMRNDASRLERARRDLSDARSSYQQRVSALGEERAAEDYADSLREREREVAAVAESIQRNTRQAISSFEAGRQPTLTPEEMRAASGAMAFVKEDVATLAPVQLRDKMKAAVLAGDRAAMWLYARYVPMATLQETGAAGEVEAMREIRDLVGAMKRELQDTRFDGPLNEARELLGRAVDLGTNARRRQTQQDAEAVVTRILGGPGVRIPGTAA